VAIPVLDFKKFRDSQVRALRSGMGGGTIPGVFKGPDPAADGRALVEIGTEGNIVSVPHGGGAFPVGGEVVVQRRLATAVGAQEADEVPGLQAQVVVA